MNRHDQFPANPLRKLIIQSFAHKGAICPLSEQEDDSFLVTFKVEGGNATLFGLQFGPTAEAEAEAETPKAKKSRAKANAQTEAPASPPEEPAGNPEEKTEEQAEASDPASS